MNKIYTKTGDNGETGLVGGQRVPKDDPRIVVFGELDELGAVLGMCRAEIGLSSGDLEGLNEVNRLLKKVQGDLLSMGAILAGGSDVPDFGVAELETEIDKVDDKLPELKDFILAGGSRAGAQLHFARAVCRRCERSLVHMKAGSDFMAYLNRLSDLLFVLARWINKCEGIGDEKWRE